MVANTFLLLSYSSLHFLEWFSRSIKAVVAIKTRLCVVENL